MIRADLAYELELFFDMLDGTACSFSILITHSFGLTRGFSRISIYYVRAVKLEKSILYRAYQNGRESESALPGMLAVDKLRLLAKQSLIGSQPEPFVECSYVLAGFTFCSSVSTSPTLDENVVYTA